MRYSRCNLSRRLSASWPLRLAILIASVIAGYHVHLYHQFDSKLTPEYKHLQVFFHLFSRLNDQFSVADVSGCLLGVSNPAPRPVGSQHAPLLFQAVAVDLPACTEAVCHSGEGHPPSSFISALFMV